MSLTQQQIILLAIMTSEVWFLTEQKVGEKEEKESLVLINCRLPQFNGK